MNTAILIFDGAEELDFVGPLEVLASAAKLHGSGGVRLVAEHERPVRCAKGMRVLPDLRLDQADDAFDLVLVPGGEGRRAQVDNPAVIAWLQAAGPRARWLASVCTGAFLLHAAGLSRGKRVTTHWRHVDELRARGEIEVVVGPRYVRDGNLLSGAGVSAGIDLALWLVGELHGVALARETRRQIEYEPAPPYTADV